MHTSSTPHSPYIVCLLIRVHSRAHVTLLALAVQACAGASAPIDAGSPAPAPSCELQIGSCPTDHPLEVWKVLLDAEDFGAGARLIALGGQAVLVSDADARFHAVRIHAENEAARLGQPYSTWAFPDAELQGIDVAEQTDSVSGLATGVLALACSPDRVRCTLLRGQAGAATLVELPDAELPAGFEPRGLVVDRDADAQAPCAYGNGLLCLAAGWQDAIAREPDLRVNHVDIDDLWSLAVGSHGRYWKRERDGSGTLLEWIEQPPLADVELTEASVSGRGGVILGEGRLQAALGFQHPNFGCGTPDALQTFFLDPYSPTQYQYALAVTEAGDVLRRLPNAAPGEFCLYQRIDAGPVLDSATAPCGIVGNFRVLSERAVIGTNFCAMD